MLVCTRDKKGNLVYNLSKPENYYSQRNNELDPMNTCSTTAMIQALEIAGYQFPDIFPNYKQPEDKLTYFIRNDSRVLSYWKTLDFVSYNNWCTRTGNYYQPNEIHAVLSYGTNLFMGKVVTRFIGGYSIDSIVQELLVKEKPCVMSGRFSGLNHIVTLVGCAVKEKVLTKKKIENIRFDDIEYFLIDDTYGETGNYKQNKYGNDVIITPKRFLNEFKDLSNKTKKWCHVIF